MTDFCVRASEINYSKGRNILFFKLGLQILMTMPKVPVTFACAQKYVAVVVGAKSPSLVLGLVDVATKFACTPS